MSDDDLVKKQHSSGISFFFIYIKPVFQEMVTVITHSRVLPEQPRNMPTTRNSCNNPMATVIEKLDHVLSTS